MPKQSWRADADIRTQARHFRQQATHAETLLWEQLRARRCANLKWRRQHPIGPFIVDFYCAEHQLIVELDGVVHAHQVERDAERTAWLQHAGYRVIRFTHDDVEQNITFVLKMIQQSCIN